jgi:outer membrane protein
MRWEARNVSVRFQRYGGVAIAALVWLVLLGWGTPAWAAQAAVRIGVLDMQEVLNKSQKGMAVKQKLDQERAARQKELDAKREEIMKLQADFEKQAPLLSEQAKREKSEAIQRKTRDTVRIAEDANRDFEKRVREAELDITREIFGVVQEYGKDQGYSLILERSTVVFGAPAVDITSEIIKRYDSKQK